MPYEYRLLTVTPDDWDDLQRLIDDLARAGFRYRDSLRRDADRAVLVFEREAAAPSADAWAAARTMMERKPARPERPKAPPEGPKYPVEEE
ncbi:MAG: hypothetical protein IT323_10625 [Anaerolineae bacterium]|nr:hypothetical protein [Anaerolineae bacterium]